MNNITRDKILLNSVWSEGILKIYSDVFKTEVPIYVYASELQVKYIEKIISEKTVQKVNDFLNLNEKDKLLMQKLLYKHYLYCCENISYGADILEGESEFEANIREFGITDEQAAFEESNLRQVYIEEDDLRNNRFVQIEFYPDWDTEAGCILIIKNGVLLDSYYENGFYTGILDN